MKKALLSIAALLMSFAMALGVAGCAVEGGGVDIGIVLPTKDEPRWLQDEAKFQEVVGKTDYKTEILFSQGKSDVEKSNVENLLAKGIKVLIICPQDAAAAAAATQAAADKGVKVISYDRLITGTDSIDFYVTFDSVAVGEAQAQYLVDKTSGSGNPLYLYAGAASDNNAFLFFEGAWNVLQPLIADGTYVIKNSSEAVALSDKAVLSREEQGKIINQISTNWDFNTAKSLAEAHLTNASEADKGDVFVLAPNDGTSRAIADTFGNDPAVSSYVITGQDAEKPSVQYIIDGKQSMTVFKDTRTLASDAMNMAIQLIDGDTPETGSAYDNGVIEVPAKQTNTVSVDSENVKAVLIDSGYYSASDFTGLN